MLSCQKHLFSLPESVHYLNCAYMSPVLKRVEEAGIEGIRRKRDPSAITPADFFEDAHRVRRLFARLINAADPHRIAIIPSVSYGVATVAKNTRVGRRQNIVVAHQQFPSNVYAWRRLAAETGSTVRTVEPPDAATRGEEWTGRLIAAITRSTRVVALGPVHWADGTRFDLDQIAARTKEVGAALVIDGTQSIGATPFDVQRLEPDAVICAAYKWLLGPYSIGLAYLGERYDRGTPLEETWMSRPGSDDFGGLVRYRDKYRSGASRYDMGESSNFILMPMLLAALEQILGWGVEEIEAYCRALTADFREEARRLGYGIEDDAWQAPHLFGLRVPPGVRRADLQAMLALRGISVSVRGDAVRVSPHVYNDAVDIAALLEVLREAVATASPV
ncbi:MAG: aminotransferase class V-fold PLP-dependent enzyme [Gemmatimonadales bacterium]|nr:aminotransferase class V-fold PLP-dependent enzyme [Gemmatimonadales bacterium]